jgi:hypothetical protein
MRGRTRYFLLVLLSVLLAGLLPVAHAAPATPIKYPDLRSLIPPSDLAVAYESGRKVLHFTHVIFNAGEGPLEIRPEYDPATDMASGFQRLYTVDDTGKLVLAQEVSIADGKLLFFWHAPHHHYHFPIAEHGLYEVTADGGVGAPVSMSPKLGYCLSDTELVEPRDLSPTGTVYGADRCFNPTRIIGISAGWGDVYQWTEPGQSIDVNDVSDGFYWFRSTVDPDNYLIESDKTNNTTDVLIAIQGDTVSVVQEPGFTPGRCVTRFGNNVALDPGPCGH